MTNSTTKTEAQINEEFFAAIKAADEYAESVRLMEQDALLHEEYEEKPMAIKETQKLFKFKQGEKLDGNNIRIDNIEQASAGHVSNALISSLEERKILEQRYDASMFETKYYFNTTFDIKLVALLGTQLCRPLVWMDIPLPLETVAGTTIVWKHFRNIARANMSIMKSFDSANDTKAHWVQKALNGLQTALQAGLLTQVDGGYIRSDKFLGMCISRSSIAHQKKSISIDSRRKERVKTRFNPKKDGTSARVRDALGFIEGQAQTVNTRLLDAILEVRDWYTVNNYQLPEVFTDGRHVIDGCAELRDEDELFSEYFHDLRGRMYQFAHYGPNPQGADMSKALCYHTIAEVTKINTPAYTFFMTEFNEEVLPGSDSVWATEKMIRATADRPAEALKYALRNNMMFSKFFTYMDMCKTWTDFADKGEAISQLGFGPDAKTSGAQILAILAGDADKARACGLTDLAERLDDLYKQSAACVERRCKSDPRFSNVLTITRNEIKTPFMAVQYGGGVPALRYKKFEPVLEAIGVPANMRDAFCKDVVIKGIKEALGENISALIESIQDEVARKLQEDNKTWFSYRHIDGFTCTKKGEATVVLTSEHFRINIGDGSLGVIFGATEEAKGGQKGWEVQSRTQGLLQAANFAYYFPVHFIQGVDAVMARTIALESKRAGLRGYTTIHDQFRVCLNDAPKMMVEVVPATYEWMFLENNPLQHLIDQTDMCLHSGNPLQPIPQIVTREKLVSPSAFYFE